MFGSSLHPFHKHLILEFVESATTESKKHTPTKGWQYMKTTEIETATQQHMPATITHKNDICCVEKAMYTSERNRRSGSTSLRLYASQKTSRRPARCDSPARWVPPPGARGILDTARPVPQDSAAV